MKLDYFKLLEENTELEIENANHRKELERMDVLIGRALILIESEWGYDKERALKWLNDDEYEWGEL